ncbi:MAG: hypothetical protein SGPRY_003948 [Prymnesium sp.]
MGQQESDDILQWELNQLGKLKELATLYDWREKSVLYKERMRLILAQIVVRQLTSGPQNGKKFANFTSARSMLGTGSHGKWLNDREAPSGKNWRRFISMDKATEISMSLLITVRVAESKSVST